MSRRTRRGTHFRSTCSRGKRLLSLIRTFQRRWIWTKKKHGRHNDKHDETFHNQPIKMTEDSTDCLQCRLTSGLGLAAAGAYVVYQSKNLKPFSRHVVASIGYGFGLLGFLRAFKLPPFRNQKVAVEKTTIENKEDNEYIIGKFSKFN